MSELKLYYSPVSPAARSTLLTIAALELDVELIVVNLMAGEHLTPQYLKVSKTKCHFKYLLVIDHMQLKIQANKRFMNIYYIYCISFS